MTDSELVRHLFTYSKTTGVFTWRNPQRMSHMKRGDTAGGQNGDGYIHIRFRGRITKGHILAWLYVKGEWPEHKIDHRDGNRGNNRWRNLRPASYPLNAQNRCLQKNNTSGFTGIYPRFCPRLGVTRFSVRLIVGRVLHRVGIFNSLEEAIRARLEAKRQLHPFQPVPRELLNRPANCS